MHVEKRQRTEVLVTEPAGTQLLPQVIARGAAAQAHLVEPEHSPTVAGVVTDERYGPPHCQQYLSVLGLEKVTRGIVLIQRWHQPTAKECLRERRRLRAQSAD